MHISFIKLIISLSENVFWRGRVKQMNDWQELFHFQVTELTRNNTLGVPLPVPYFEFALLHRITRYAILTCLTRYAILTCLIKNVQVFHSQCLRSAKKAFEVFQTATGKTREVTAMNNDELLYNGIRNDCAALLIPQKRLLFFLVKWEV